jgi:hypothetical protein
MDSSRSVTPTWRSSRTRCSWKVAATGGSSAFVDQCTICAPLPELLEQGRKATSRELTRDERLTYLAR